MGKREAAATNGVSKKSKIDPVMEKCTLVIATLEKWSDLPKTTCDMLKRTIPLSLGICHDDRHDYQKCTIEAVARELAKIEEKHQQKIKDEEVTYSIVDKEKQQQEAAVLELETTLSTKQDLLEKNKLELYEQAITFQDTKRALKEAENRQENHVTELSKVGCKIVDLEGILQGTFQSLKEGSIEKQEAIKLASELVANLQRLFDINETLATTIPSALGREPKSRGPFDTIAIQHVEEDIEKHLDEWRAIVSNAEAAKTEHVVKVRTASEALKIAEEKQAATAETFTSARKELEEIEQLLAQAKKTLKAFPAALQKAEKKLRDAQDKFDFFRQGPLFSFTELRDRNDLYVENSIVNVVAEEFLKSEAEARMVMCGA